jgi:hypothetical protein
MLIYLRKRTRAQSTAEYVILVGLVIAAIMIVTGYVKRGLSGKVKTLADDFLAAGGTGAGLFEGDEKLHRASLGSANTRQQAGYSQNDAGKVRWKVERDEGESVKATITGDLDEAEEEVHRFTLSSVEDQMPWGKKDQQLSDEAADQVGRLTQQ